MKIIDKLVAGKPAFSFEFFPPKGEEGLARLLETLGELRPYEPAYVSVTDGAGGSTQSLTLELVAKIKKEIGLEAMAHLTCVGASREQLAEVLTELAARGIDNVLALRGDPPRGSERFEVAPGGFAHASELTAFVKQNFDFCIGGACYPEVHPEAASPEADLDALKEKVDSGADFLVTQLFFDNADLFRFLDRVRAARIEVPVVAGIMPITNVAQIKRFTSLCGARIPDSLLAQLEPHEEDQKAVREIGVSHATEQCADLVRQGIAGIHFYTLNRSTATRQILDRLRAAGLA